MRFSLLLLSMQGRIALSIFPGGSVIGTVVKWLTEQEVGRKTSFSGDTSFPHFGDICPLSIVCMGQKVKENLSKEGKKKENLSRVLHITGWPCINHFFCSTSRLNKKKMTRFSHLRWMGEFLPLCYCVLTVGRLPRH